MVRYTGPRIRIVRRLGLLVGLTRKFMKNRTSTPGEHGIELKEILKKKNSNRTFLSEDYKNRLLEKQKLRFNYGVTEKQLLSYYKQAKKSKGSTGTLLLELLEARLDCVVYRFGFAPTIPAARQLVNHGHIFVNEKRITIPSFLCEKGDIISVSEKPTSTALVTKHFEFQQQKRELVQRRMRSVNLVYSFLHTLLPSHLELDSKALRGTILSTVNRNDLLVRVKELKVVEYYSR